MHARLLLSGALLCVACGDSDATGGPGGAGGAGPAGPTVTATVGSAPTSSATGASTTTGATTTGGGGASPGCGSSEAAGTTDETLEVGGTVRSYVLVVPDGLDGVTPVPIIFGFHGFNGTGTSASQYFGLTGAEPALYVYPQALPLPGQNGGVGWDMEADGVDVAFIDALILALAAAHCVDTSRVFAAGHSHGASFSNHLGCYRPDAIRAIAPVAGGGPWAGACTGSVAAMVSHGTNDVDVPLSNGEGSRDHWLMANGCSGAGSTPVTPPPCVAYDGCAEAVRWCQHDGGHEWPDFAGDGIRAFFLSF